MRLIDADALEYHEIDEIGGEYKPYLGCSKEYIDRQPTIVALDKIRAEIEELDRYYDNDYFSGNRDAMFKCNDVLQIIDKYTKGEDDAGK